MTELSEQFIKSIKQDTKFSILSDYIDEKVQELKNIEDLVDMSTTQAGETVRIRAMTIVKLQEILKPFVNFKEKREFSDDEIQGKKMRYGL